MERFGEWLEAQLAEKGWKQAELARRAHISQPTLSRIINDTRKVGPDAARSIARALGEAPEEVFRLAGLLPPAPSRSRLREFDRIAAMLASLPDGPIRDEAMAAIEAIAESARRRALGEKAQ